MSVCLLDCSVSILSKSSRTWTCCMLEFYCFDQRDTDYFGGFLEALMSLITGYGAWIVEVLYHRCSCAAPAGFVLALCWNAPIYQLLLQLPSVHIHSSWLILTMNQFWSSCNFGPHRLDRISGLQFGPLIVKALMTWVKTHSRQNTLQCMLDSEWHLCSAACWAHSGYLLEA